MNKREFLLLLLKSYCDWIMLIAFLLSMLLPATITTAADDDGGDY